MGGISEARSQMMRRRRQRGSWRPVLEQFAEQVNSTERYFEQNWRSYYVNFYVWEKGHGDVFPPDVIAIVEVLVKRQFHSYMEITFGLGYVGTCEMVVETFKPVMDTLDALTTSEQRCNAQLEMFLNVSNCTFLIKHMHRVFPRYVEAMYKKLYELAAIIELRGNQSVYKVKKVREVVDVFERILPDLQQLHP